MHRPPRSPGKRRYGFTLIELVVTVAVIGIVAVVAIPSMRSLINSGRLSSAAEDMTAGLQLARAEALRRNASVRVCASSDGASCTGGADWSRWIVLGNDSDGDSNADVIRDETAAGEITFKGPAAGIRFRSSGLIEASTTVTVCMPTSQPAENQRVITVNISGSVETAKANGGGAC